MGILRLLFNWKISGISLPGEVLEKVYSKNAIRVLKLDLQGARP